MTVVVGVEFKKGVLLAADAQWSGHNSNRIGAQAKVHVLMDTVAIGYCGSGRFGQILQHHLVDLLEDPFLPRDERDEEYWAVREFVPFLRDITETHGHLHIHHNVEEFGPSAFLLAVRGVLFSVESDFSVNRHRLPYEAVGSGEDNAIGVLHNAFGDDPDIVISQQRAESVARKAVAAATTFNNYVGGPCSVVQTMLYTDDERLTAKRILKR